jgi:hypothetical protein
VIFYSQDESSKESIAEERARAAEKS